MINLTEEEMKEVVNSIIEVVDDNLQCMMTTNRKTFLQKLEDEINRKKHNI